jgi:hypothetical protein
MSVDIRPSDRAERERVVNTGRLLRRTATAQPDFTTSNYLTALLYEVANVVVFEQCSNEDLEQIFAGLRHNIEQVRSVEGEVRTIMAAQKEAAGATKQ